MDGAEFEIGKVLVAVRMSERCRPVIRSALAVAGIGGAALDGLLIYGPDEYLGQGGGAEFARAQAIKDLDAAVRQLVPGAHGRIGLRAARGEVAATIRDIAAEYDLIVVGASEKPTRARLIGGVAERLIREAPCPVLVVRPGPKTDASSSLARAATVRVRDGSHVLFRPVVPSDKELLVEGLAALSTASRYRRFMTAGMSLSEAQLRYLTEIDYCDHMAWGAVEADAGAQRGLGVARYVRLPDEPNVAEPAVAVVDAYHGRGLGTSLLGALSRSAAANGIDTFRAYVLEDNAPMLRILRQLGAVATPTGGGEVVVDVPVPEDPGDLPSTPVGKVFKAVAQQMIPASALSAWRKEILSRVASLFPTSG